MIQGKDFAEKLLGKEYHNLYEKLRTEYSLVDILDVNGNVRYVSNTLQAALGCTENDLIGKNAIQTLVHPDDLEYVSNAFQRLVKDNSPQEVKFELRKKDGSYFVARSVCLPLIQDGDVFGYIILTKKRIADIVAFRRMGRMLLDRAV